MGQLFESRQADVWVSLCAEVFDQYFIADGRQSGPNQAHFNPIFLITVWGSRAPLGTRVILAVGWSMLERC